MQVQAPWFELRISRILDEILNYLRKVPSQWE